MANLPSLPTSPVYAMAPIATDGPVASPAVRTGLQVAIAEALLRVLHAQVGIEFTGTDAFLALTVLTAVVAAAINKVEGVLGIKLLAPR